MTAVFPGSLDEAMDQSEDRARALESDNTRTHTGNAERLARLHGDALRYALGIGWLWWDGTRWVPDEMGAPFRAAQDVAKEIHAEAAVAFQVAGKADSDDDRKKAQAVATRIWNWARDSAQTNHIESTLRNASNHKRFRVAPEDLDAQPELLNCQNGTLDLTTFPFELRPHDPADLLTKIALAAFDPDAPAPNWEVNLKRFIPDDEVRAYMQRAVGVALLGYRTEEIQYLWGVGGNFKSSFLRALLETLGDYAYHTDPDLLIAQSNRKSVSDKAMLAELRGKRLVTTSEIDADQALAEGMAKVLTDPVIRGELKHRDGFDFRNEMSLMFSANHKLRIEGTDDGIWRRLRLSEWSVQVSDDEKDEQYFEKHLAGELDGILAWAVRGLQDYRARGDRTDPPEQVKAWTQHYRQESDLVGSWLAEEAELVPDEAINANELWSSFDAFQRGEKGGRVSRTDWKQRILAIEGITEERPRQADGTRARVFVGIKLTAPAV
jgi:putative DNA primase/helicase